MSRGDNMQYLKTYLKKISDRGNPKLAESILKTADDVGDRYIKKFSFADHEIGLLFGNVQSGKTGQMFALCARRQIWDFLYLFCLRQTM